jgi:hypothetical protein
MSRRIVMLASALIAAHFVAIGTVLVCQCIDLVMAEQKLRSAAAAALEEATLPKATRDTVIAAATRSLQKSRIADIVDRPLIAVRRNSFEPGIPYDFQTGDQIQVTIGAFASDVVPDWLAPLGLSISGRRLYVSLTAIKP